MFTNLLVCTGLVALGGYLLGSIPFGLVLTKLAGMGDIRAIGSGNIGATNVLRTGKKGLAALTLLLDGGKGVAAVLLAVAFVTYVKARWNPDGGSYGHNQGFLFLCWPYIAGLAAVIGHIFPIWLRFKGGKGVATSFGVFLAFAWPVGLACMATWLLVAVIFRISSLSALLAMMLAPVFIYVWSQDQTSFIKQISVGSTVIIAVLVIAKHHENIRRLLKGEEPRIGKST